MTISPSARHGVGQQRPVPRWVETDPIGLQPHAQYWPTRTVRRTALAGFTAPVRGAAPNFTFPLSALENRSDSISTAFRKLIGMFPSSLY